MKTFLDSIRARAEQAKATIAKADTLALLELAVDETKAEFDQLAGVQNNPQKDVAHAAWTAANHAADRVRRSIAEAKNVLESCTPILNAHADLAAAHVAYAEAREVTNASLAEITNLHKLIAELNGEIADLSAKAKQALAAHGQTSAAARLTGQQAPPTPKLITTLSADLESRQATLESASAMLANAQKCHDHASNSTEQFRRQWQEARAQVATIEYHDALATIAPQLSIYLAAVGGYQIEFAPEHEAMNAAHELLNAELEQVSRVSLSAESLGKSSVTATLN